MTKTLEFVRLRLQRGAKLGGRSIPKEPGMTDLMPLEGALLARGIRSRFVRNINGLHVHVLEPVMRPAAGLSSCCCTDFRSSPIRGER
jgi:hypothetical protein